MNGKEKCKLLKSIRRDIASKNGIPLNIPECSHKGDCLGSCPRCEAEVKYLERQLEIRQKRGIKPIIAGISAGLITVTAASCDFPNITTVEGDMMPETDGSSVETNISGTLEGEYELDGDIAFIPDGESIGYDDLVLQGDIAYPIDSDDEEDTEDTEIELAGMLLAPEDEYGEE